MVTAQKESGALGCIQRRLAKRLMEVILPLYASLMRHCLEHCVQRWGPQHKEMELLEHVQRKVTKLIRGLEKVREQAEEVIIEYPQLEGSSTPIPDCAQH